MDEIAFRRYVGAKKKKRAKFALFWFVFFVSNRKNWQALFLFLDEKPSLNFYCIPRSVALKAIATGPVNCNSLVVNSFGSYPRWSSFNGCNLQSFSPL